MLLSRKTDLEDLSPLCLHAARRRFAPSCHRDKKERRQNGGKGGVPSTSRSSKMTSVKEMNVGSMVGTLRNHLLPR